MPIRELVMVNTFFLLFPVLEQTVSLINLILMCEIFLFQEAQILCFVCHFLDKKEDST